MAHLPIMKIHIKIVALKLALLMRYNKSLIIILSITVIISIMIGTNFSSFSFGQEKTNTKIIGFNHIRKFDSNGKFITSWGSRGSGEGQFVVPESIAVDSMGNVFVADYGNRNIQKFDSNGKFITSWGSKGSGNGQFNENHGIDIDSSGNVYVVDTRNNRIQKFSSDGTFIRKWGSTGCGTDEFLIPHDITIDSSDNVYISDSGNVHFKSKVKCP